MSRLKLIEVLGEVTGGVPGWTCQGVRVTEPVVEVLQSRQCNTTRRATSIVCICDVRTDHFLDLHRMEALESSDEFLGLLQGIKDPPVVTSEARDAGRFVAVAESVTLNIEKLSGERAAA
jgi:hypothetical protein